jgi:tetratricopeptide (TPR) repeat protein
MALPSGRFTVKTLRLYSADAGARKSLDAGVKGPGFIRFQEVDVYKFKKGEEPALQILPGEATRLAIDLPPEFLAKIKTEGAALADKAQKFFDEKDYEQALALFQQVVNEYPKSSGARYAQMMVGLCYGHLNQPDKQIAALERVVRDYPQADLAATYFYLGAAYEDAKRMDDALAAYRQSLQRAERIGRADAFPGKDARKRIEALEAASRGVMTAGQPGAAASQPSAAPASDLVRRARRTQFEVRQRRDLQKYTRQQLSEAEQLYQVANKNWRSPEARESLDQMIAKYPDINRTGCAVLYMAQWARGDERIQLLQRAIEKHGDCMYGDGVQVGAYARFYLAEIYDEAGQKDKARALYDEIRKLFPLAVNHRGIPLAQLIEASHPQTQPAEAAK